LFSEIFLGWLGKLESRQRSRGNTRAQDNINLSWQTRTDSGAAPKGKLETHRIQGPGRPQRGQKLETSNENQNN
jgi:hypothetical protein